MTDRIVPTTLGRLAGWALVACVALPAGAQRSQPESASSDSAAFIVPRRAPAAAESSITTRDRKVVLVLRDSVVVFQLTDSGMERLFDGDTVTGGIGSRMLARMLKAGISELLDHGIAYRLSHLKRAYADGSRLVLEDRDGTHVFENVDYNKHHPMEEFAPSDAARFAAILQRVIGRR